MQTRPLLCPQAIAALQQQQQLQRQLLVQQQVIANQTAAATGMVQPVVNDFDPAAPPTASNKKHRELYVGNLASGQVGPDLIRELFNSVLANMVPDPLNAPPVLEVKFDPTGRGEGCAHGLSLSG